jgi:hypothetical protein
MWLLEIWELISIIAMYELFMTNLATVEKFKPCMHGDNINVACSYT